jgi:acyl-CoA thioester hydrolase
MIINDLTSFPVTVTLPVRWGEMDAFKHVNNVIYFSYFESARITYLEKLDYVNIAEKTGLSIILGSIECKFIAPLFYPDSITVGAKISLIKQDRFSMDYAIFSSSQKKIVAVGSSVVVAYSYKQKTKTTLPESLINLIKKLENNFENKNV